MSKVQINKAQIYYFDKKTKQKKSRNTIVKRTFQFIPRADNLSKELSVKAANLMETLNSMLGKQELTYVTHEFLSSITRVNRRQNCNLFKQLTHIFDISYRHSVKYKGKTLHEVLEIKRTENGREIIDNPEKFFSKEEQSGREKIYSNTGKKLLGDAKKITRPIYNDNLENNKDNNDNYQIIVNDNENNHDIISCNFDSLIINDENVRISQQKNQFRDCYSSSKSLAELILSNNTTTFKDGIPRKKVRGKDGKMYSAIPLAEFKFDEEALDEIIYVSNRMEFTYIDVVTVIQNIIKKQPDKLIYGGRKGFIQYMIHALEGEYGIKKSNLDNKTNPTEYMKQVKVEEMTSKLEQGNEIRWM